MVLKYPAYFLGKRSFISKEENKIASLPTYALQTSNIFSTSTKNYCLTYVSTSFNRKLQRILRGATRQAVLMTQYRVRRRAITPYHLGKYMKRFSYRSDSFHVTAYDTRAPWIIMASTPHKVDVPTNYYCRLLLFTEAKP